METHRFNVACEAIKMGGTPSFPGTILTDAQVEEIRQILEWRKGLMDKYFTNVVQTRRANPMGGDFVRASGDAICTGCDKPFSRHGDDMEELYRGEPYLKVLCDGTRVKL